MNEVALLGAVATRKVSWRWLAGKRWMCRHWATEMVDVSSLGHKMADVLSLGQDFSEEKRIGDAWLTFPDAGTGPGPPGINNRVCSGPKADGRGHGRHNMGHVCERCVYSIGVKRRVGLGGKQVFSGHCRQHPAMVCRGGVCCTCAGTGKVVWWKFGAEGS